MSMLDGMIENVWLLGRCWLAQERRESVSALVSAGSVGLSLSPAVAAGVEALATLDAAGLRDVVRSSFVALTTASSAGVWAPPPLLTASEVVKAGAAGLCTLLLEAAKLLAPADVVKCVRCRARCAWAAFGCTHRHTHTIVAVNVGQC